MINKIKNKIAEGNNKKLLTNYLSLTILQFAHYLLPLITLPYLLRVIGVENFGLISFAAAIAAYLMVLTQFGFELTAVKEISVNKDNKEKLIEIFSSVMIIKLSLLLLAFVILLIVIFTFEKFEYQRIIYILSFGLVLGNTLFPTWFFQGIEQMKYITYINMSLKVFFTALIFVFVTSKEDFYIVPILTSLGGIIGGVYALYFINKKFDIHIKFQKINTLKHYIQDSWHMFVTSLSINLYTNGFTIILGLFSSLTVVGYYSAAEKLILAINSLIRPVYQTVYPHIMEMMSKSEEKAVAFIRKVVLAGSVLNFFVFLSIFLLSEFIITTLYGKNYELSITIFKILSVLPIIVGLNNIMGIQVVMAYNLKKEFSKLVIYIGLTSVIICVPLSYYFNAVGTAISMVLIESIFLLTVFIFLSKKNIKIFRK